MSRGSALGDAAIVVVGGGAVGSGVAYSLARAGHTDVLVLEREAGLGAATTAQAAGLVGQVRADADRVRLAMWSVATFRELQSDPDTDPGWRETGSLRVATDPVRVEEFDHLREVARQAGLEVYAIGPAEAERLWPGMSFAHTRAILYCPSDGYLQPTDLTAAYRTDARRRGVRFATGTRVESVRVERDRVTAVGTGHGEVRCEWVIDAAGAHAYHVARLAGLELPIVPVRHHMFVTVPVPGVRPDLPVVRAVDGRIYIRPEVGSLLVGGWEPSALSADPRSYRLDQPAPPLAEDWPVLGEFAAALAEHYEQGLDLGVRTTFRGWPTFTPDGRFVVGESSRVRGFVLAAGCNAHGVSGSAGIGQHVVQAMFDPAPPAYVRSLSPDRFTGSPWDWPSVQSRARHWYETYYAPAAHAGAPPAAAR